MLVNLSRRPFPPLIDATVFDADLSLCLEAFGALVNGEGFTARAMGKVGSHVNPPTPPCLFTDWGRRPLLAAITGAKTSDSLTMRAHTGN